MTGFVPRSSPIVKPASDGRARRAFSTWLLGRELGPTAAPRSVSCARSGLHLRRFLVRIASQLDVRDDQVLFGLDSMELHEVYAIRVEEV